MVKEMQSSAERDDRALEHRAKNRAPVFSLKRCDDKSLDQADDSHSALPALDRRSILAGGALLAALPATAALAQAGLPSKAFVAPLNAATVTDRWASVDVCELTPTTMEGPYFINNNLLRSDIRDGKPGQTVRLRLQVFNGNARCRPLAGAAVSVWQCDSKGFYSGYSHQHPDEVPPDLGVPGATPRKSSGTTGHAPEDSAPGFLRGIQTADVNGEVVFTTIVPGWYAFRAPHIHVKVFVGQRELLTTQFYFPQAFLGAVFSSGVYATRSPGLNTNENDFVRRQSHMQGLEGVLKLTSLEDGTIEALGRLALSHG